MTPRSIRRAAERKAKKKARKAANHLAPAFTLSDSSPDSEPAHEAISSAQLAANRANAQFSAGAKTAEGKAASSLNAVTNALTGRTVLLRTDDAAAYQAHVAAYQNDLQPVGQRESDLVQSIADSAWRLHRIAGLEMAIFAQGHIQFAESFQEHDPSLRPGMIELQTFITYEKQLRNLQLQEARLARRREKETTELRNLQKERRAKEEDALDRPTRGQTAGRDDNFFGASANGFEFSPPELALDLTAIRAAAIAEARASRDAELEGSHTNVA